MAQLKQKGTGTFSEIEVATSSDSIFTLTFVLEAENTDIEDQEPLKDPGNGWVSVGKCSQIINLNYTLYPNRSFGITVEVFPCAAKVVCGKKFCWVRTWKCLDRRWLCFTIKHVVSVRVRDLKMFNVNVTFSCSPGKDSTTNELSFPTLPFGVLQNFGPVEDYFTSDLEDLLKEWIWKEIKNHIPASYMDGPFSEPFPVSDKRHQDQVLGYAQTGNSNLSKNNQQISLSGERILAAVGRIIPFQISGQFPMGDMAIFLSTDNLPSKYDDPIFFVNIEKLFDAPLDQLRKLGITRLFTRWSVGEEVFDSEHINIEHEDETEILFDDHHVMPLEPAEANRITSAFLEERFVIELRGINMLSKQEITPRLFGYDKRDREYDVAEPKIPNNEEEILIALAKIEARSLAKGLSTYIRGEYPLYPAISPVPHHVRTGKCTNDINLIGIPFNSDVFVPASLVLSAQMTLDVSVGVVGCKPPRLTSCFSRMYCLISHSMSAMAMLAAVRTINDELALSKPESMLTGFAADTGDVLVLYLEGPRDGNILKIWELSEEFHPDVKPVFNSTSRYTTRIYEEFLEATMPFIVIKCYTPLAALLACPAVYARPALPNPARTAALKLGRLIQYRYRSMPFRHELPTPAELASFRLELCTPLRSSLSDTRHSGGSKETLQLEHKKPAISENSNSTAPLRVKSRKRSTLKV